MDDPKDRLRYAQEFALAGLRTLTLLNGGGLIGLFTFIGHENAKYDHALIRFAALCFALGLVLTVVAMASGFASHAMSRQENERSGSWWEKFGLLCTFASLTLFLSGTVLATIGVMP
jgi:hypothetical protein